MRRRAVTGGTILPVQQVHESYWENLIKALSRRTVRDVVNVVCVGEQVIRKRLSEFEQTPSAQLTCEQFVEGEVDLEEQADPPAFSASLIKVSESSQLQFACSASYL